MSNKSVNLAKKIKNDEFYTIYEQFEAVVNKWLIDKLEDKIIYKKKKLINCFKL